MYMEGSMSQFFDIGLSFCFIVCRRWKFKKKKKKKVTRFLSQNKKLRPKQKNLRQASLDTNDLYTHSKFGICK